MRLTVDKHAALAVAMAWALAARSPHTLVYLPLRHDDRACGHYGTGDERLLDLGLPRQWLPVEYCAEHRVRAAKS